MSRSAVHQFVPALVPRDAVSLHTLEVQEVIRALGFASEIFVEFSVGEMRPRSRYYRDFDAADGSAVLLYQASTGCALGTFVTQARGKVVVNYHNLTPPEFFAPWEPEAVVSLNVGRRQLADLASRGAPALADSAYNEGDLRGMGFQHVAVAPVLLDPAARHPSADRAAVDALRARSGGAPRLLFVGRIAPNKAQHDLVKAVAAHRALFGADTRLTLVGATASPGYAGALRRLIDAAGLSRAVEWLTAVSEQELADLYGAADVFLCLSDHEGFCVPLLEAMRHSVPVVAYAAGAVPETAGPAALILEDKDATTVAHALQRVLTDDAVRRHLVREGSQRLGCFSLERTRHQFGEALLRMMERSRRA